MTKTKIIGAAAVIAFVLGYGGMAVTVALAGLELITPQVAVFAAVALGLVGEAGLWVAAATLGWTMFSKRKAILDRILGRKAGAAEEVV